MTDYVVANINGGYDCIYCFCKPEEAPAIIQKAQEEAAESARRFAEIGGEYFARCAENERRAKYELMTFDEFLRRQRAEMLGGQLIEVTAEEFDKQLGVLPPLHFVTIDGVTMFCMSEFDCGPYTTQYARYNGKYYCATVDAYDPETWLHKRLKRSEKP